MKNIVVLASGGGTNLQALIDEAAAGRLGGRIALVISSKKEAGALEQARKAGIAAEALPPADFGPGEHDRKLVELCRAAKADLVCLAGYLLKLGPELLKAYEGKILNIHPALLPAFGGKGYYGIRVHQAVLAAGVRVTGATAHFVTADYDSGPIVQRTVPVLAGDTPELLAARVLTAEHSLFPEAVKLFCAGRLSVKEGRVEIAPPPATNGTR